MNSINKGGNIRTITNEECDFLKGGLKGNSKKVDSIYRLHKKICKVCGKNDQQLPVHLCPGSRELFIPAAFG